MNSGGHSGYFDCYPDTVLQELINAIIAAGYKEIADIYQKVLSDGENDSYKETDRVYYYFSPSLCDCLGEYVERNKEVIFN